MDIFVVDTFTEQQFKGNSAAVVPIEAWPSAELMQNIACENNLSETAFIKEVSTNHFEIRWFSPLTEIDFCGHATLAAAFILFSEYNLTGEISFITQAVGKLIISRNSQQHIVMRFPILRPEIVQTVPKALLVGINQKPIQVLKNRRAYFAILATAQQVNETEYDSEQLKLLSPYDVVVTASCEEGDYDFVSRYFWPANGGDEDPVTGSIHCGLAPYWSDVLQKNELTALQASKRAGVLHCRIEADNVIISGQAILYMKGVIVNH